MNLAPSLPRRRPHRRYLSQSVHCRRQGLRRWRAVALAILTPQRARPHQHALASLPRVGELFLFRSSGIGEGGARGATTIIVVVVVATGMEGS